MCKRIQIRALAVIAVVILVASMAMAQSTTSGAIGGSVTDPTGAVIAGAEVSVRNVSTGGTGTAKTDAIGRYRVTNLPPGTYEVEATSTNLKAAKKTGIIVEIGLVSNVEIVMGVSAVGETAEVTAEAPVVNTQQQDFTTNINQTQINELPINGRRWSQFALMTPGTNTDGSFGLVSFRGISGLLNNNTVDGGDNNNAFYSEERGRTRIGYVISQSAIQEFQVNTSNYSAEYGRAAGGVINAVTKSGTNAFHGDLFWYYRNEEFNAFNPYTTRASLTGPPTPIKPEDRRHQFGGTVGGPIIKDKLFFFYSYDQQKRSFPGEASPFSTTFFNPITVQNPTIAGHAACPAIPANGPVSNFPTNYSDGERLFCYGISQAGADAGLAYILSLTGNVARSGNQTLHLPKIDWKINKDHTLTLSYNRLRWDSPGGIQTAPVVNRARTSWGNDGVKTDSFITRVSSVLGPRVTNEARFQYGRDYLFGTPQTPAGNEPISPLGLPVETIISGSTCGSSSIFCFGTPDYIPRPLNPEEIRYQYANTTSMNIGRHQFKFGADVNRITDSVNSLFKAFGSYSYNNRADVLTDLANPANRRYNSFSQGIGIPGIEFSTTDVALFVQDDWRIHPRLTLNIGLRWEYEMLPNAKMANPLVPGTDKLPKDKDNLGPRIGFAWDIFGDGKTSFRGGWGIYYGRFVNSTVESALINTGVANAQKQFTVSPSPTAPIYPNLPPPGTPPIADVIVYPANAQAPQIYQADAIIERQLSKNTMISVSYLYSRGTHLPAFLDTNLPTTRVPLTYRINGGPNSGATFTVERYSGPRPNTAVGRITQVSHVVNSDYHAGVIQFNRRLTNGLQFQSSYTFSRADDNGQSSQTFTTANNVLDSNDISLEYGRSNLHARHRFGANAIWQPEWFSHSTNKLSKYLLSGYSVAPIISISSGRTYTGTITGNPPGCGGTLGGILCAGGVSRVPIISRNSYTSPTIFNTDLRLSKRVQVREGISVELLAEAFNLTNHVNIQGINTRQFTMGATAGGVTTLNYDATFGTGNNSAGTLSRERNLQFGFRLKF